MELNAHQINSIQDTNYNIKPPQENNAIDLPSLDSQLYDHNQSDSTPAPPKSFTLYHSETQNEPTGTSTMATAMYHVSNSILGAGVLSIPVIIRYLGLMIGTIFIVVIGLATWYSVTLLLKTHEATQKKSYALIAKSIIGEPGYWLVLLTLIWNNFGFCCAYYMVFGENWKATIQAFVSEQSYLVTNWHNYLYILVLYSIIGWIIFSDSLDSFKGMSFLGILGMIFFMFCIMIIYFYKLSQGLLPQFNSAMLSPGGNFNEMLSTWPSVLLAFSFQFNLFPIYYSLQDRNSTTMSNVTISSILLCMMVYLMVGFFGFLMYTNQLNGTVLDMLLVDIIKYKDTDIFLKFILIATNMSFNLCTTGSIPLTFYALKENCFELVDFCNQKIRDYLKKNESSKDKEMTLSQQNIEMTSHSRSPNNSSKVISFNEQISSPRVIEEISIPAKEEGISNKIKIGIVIVIYVLIGIVSITVPNLKSIFNVIGSTASNAISFIFPNLFIIVWVYQKKINGGLWLPGILLGFGAFLLIACLIAQTIIS